MKGTPNNLMGWINHYLRTLATYWRYPETPTRLLSGDYAVDRPTDCRW